MKRVSPVDKFPGHVVLPDFLTLPQVRAFEDALGDPNFLFSGVGDDKKVWLSVSVRSEVKLPVILGIVEEWHIEGQPEKPEIDTFKMTPILAANELVSWVFGEIRNIWVGETEDPK